MITGKLAPHLEIQWETLYLSRIAIIALRGWFFEIEHNFRRHKDYKDSKGANIKCLMMPMNLKSPV